MHMTKIVGQHVTNVQVSVVRDIKPYFLPFQGLLFGRVPSQHYWITRLNESAASDQNVMVRRRWRVS